MPFSAVTCTGPFTVINRSGAIQICPGSLTLNATSLWLTASTVNHACA